MSAIVSFGSCNVMLMGGGLAPFAGEGGSAWSSTGWLGGRPLCVWFFSNVGGCGVVFFGGAAGGGACPGGIAFACGYWRRDRGSGLSGCLFP